MKKSIFLILTASILVSHSSHAAFCTKEKKAQINPEPDDTDNERSFVSRPTIPDEEPDTPITDPEIPVDDPEIPVDEPEVPVDEPETPDDEPVGDPDQPDNPNPGDIVVEEPTTPGDGLDIQI